MKRCRRIAAAVIGAVLLSAPPGMAQGVVDGFRWCPGEFALCAASTCTPTGRKIEVNTATGHAPFDEAKCTCPIFPGPGLADVNGGNMEGRGYLEQLIERFSKISELSRQQKLHIPD